MHYDLGNKGGGYKDIDGIRCYAPEVAQAYTDYPSEGFDLTAKEEARSFWCRTRNRVVTQVFRRFTDRTRPLDVLDIGCGIGGVVGALRKLPNLRLTGSEIYLQGLRYARARLPDVDFIQLDATNIPFRAAFDVISAFDVIEHIPDDELVMRQVREALRPKGLFIVTVPQYQWMWSSLDDIVHHKRRYSRRELIAKLNRSGFDVIYATSFLTILFPLMMLSRLKGNQRPPSVDKAKDFSDSVKLPGPLNTLFDCVMRIDEALLRLGVTLPFGGSLLVVARSL
jgi:SAM-dependent methyltransferase